MIERINIMNQPLEDRLNEIEEAKSALAAAKEQWEDAESTLMEILGMSARKVLRIPKQAPKNMSPAGKKQGRRVPKSCCGSIGPRHIKTCFGQESAESDQEEIAEAPAPIASNTPEIPEREPTDAEAQKAEKIKTMIKEGHDNDFIASELHTSPRVVQFMRHRMRA